MRPFGFEDGDLEVVFESGDIKWIDGSGNVGSAGYSATYTSLGGGQRAPR